MQDEIWRYSMKKQTLRRSEETAYLLPEYGKQKLLTYAESFRDLARAFQTIPGREWEADTVHTMQDKQNYLWQRKMAENKDLLADHLNEMAQIMSMVAEESFLQIPLLDKQRKQIVHELKEEGILIKEIVCVEREVGHFELSVTMCVNKRVKHPTEEVAGMLSVLFNKALIPCGGAPFLVGREYETFRFEEEPKYSVLTGVSKAIKQTETVSGDNFTCFETGQGSLVAALSDGMGSGSKACKDSETVVDLLEKLLEVGFSKEAAAQMINGVLIVGSEEQNMSTLDVCDLNLYTGVCDFLKVGAAASYIKRDHLVEKIASTSLPMGVFHQIDMESSKRQLMDGDYIILISDGILDALSDMESEIVLREIISNLTLEHPKEMANQILQYMIHSSRGNIRDDMTVMVIGLWKNPRKID